MQIPRAPHRWSLSPREAVAVQRRLAGRVVQTRPARRLRFVAGLDAAFLGKERCIAGVVLWDAREGVVVEERVATRELRFPYVPGLLSFREAPALLAALRKLRRTPDALICDGQGLAHPRRFGIACHIGVVTGLPSVGCAKSILVGSFGSLSPRRGARAALTHRGETVGVALRTRDGVKPVFVSVGHRIDLESAASLVLACATGRRLPEPTHRADRRVAAEKARLRAS